MSLFGLQDARRDRRRRRSESKPKDRGEEEEEDDAKKGASPEFGLSTSSFAPPSQLVSRRASTTSRRAATAHRRVRRVDADTAELVLAGREVQIRIPDKYRPGEDEEGEEWDPEKVAEAPSARFDMEWVYGYRGRDIRVASNLQLLPRTGELVCISHIYEKEKRWRI